MLTTSFGRAGALGLAALLCAGTASPALARDNYVQDGASLFSAGTVANLNQTIGDLDRQTGKEVVVVTVPSLDGKPVATAAENAFAQQQVNGVLVFLAKAEKKDEILGDHASQAFFPSGSFDSIRQAMRGYFRDGDYDAGVTTGVGLIINGYRSHERSLNTTRSHAYAPVSSQSVGGGGMSLFWLVLILIVGFLVIRGIFRALAGGGNRMAPPGYGGPGPGGPGYGVPGYGGGYGYGGGGGNFFSGLLGGLGGAFLGNELFGHQNFGGGGFDQGNVMGGGVDPNSGGDAGWQSDPGQADPGNASSGDFGSSGGGFGGGDFGGGGGDFGGGGDSGGGW